MAETPVRGFPLFPLGIVALPGEAVPLHIFEDRYRRMIERCLAGSPGSLERAFGIVWLSEQELKPVGCACELEDVLDDLRLGRVELTVPVLDLLFQAVGLYSRILSAEGGGGGERAVVRPHLSVARRRHPPRH